MDVSVIIVNYNTLELTKNTIESVFEKTEGLNYEVILVDNASTDGSVEFFEDNYKNKIIFIKNNENLGFGKANNKGIEISKGKYIFLLNSDTLLMNNAIKILFDFMEKNIECGVCGGNLFDRDNRPVHSFKKELVNIYSDFDFVKNFILKLIYKKRIDFNYTNKNIEVGYITGADMFIRKKILEKVGIFDSDFFMYFEETELTARIKSTGKKIISVPQAKIIHLEGKSTQFKERKFRMFTESKYKYFYKVFSLREVKLAYYISQLKYLIPLNDGWMKLKINKEEYQKFLQNYKNLRKDY
ncbi:glycosyltransferase family 2 protein [Fusobacterium mortiferum]|uniref:glycosyltransferase family 2 protein n=1 Tax=Fusobacterium mortiferum TaxID=850 RepID=UPI0022E0AB63|nr:glycosyltransferase family 2 protein [Fusobacterium mortiferum]